MPSWTLPNTRDLSRAAHLRLATHALPPRDARAQADATLGSQYALARANSRAVARRKIRRLLVALPEVSTSFHCCTPDRSVAVAWESPQVDAGAPMLRSSGDLGEQRACTGSSSSFWRPRPLAARLALAALQFQGMRTRDEGATSTSLPSGQAALPQRRAKGLQLGDRRVEREGAASCHEAVD